MDLHQHFQEIRQLIRQAKSNAWAAANAHVVNTYWQVGCYLDQRLSESTYGDKVVDQLAKWLKEQEPGLKGFDRRNLYRMRFFFETWSKVDLGFYTGNLVVPTVSNQDSLPFPIVVTLSPQLENIYPPLLKLNWSQHIDLLTSTASEEERMFSSSSPSKNATACGSFAAKSNPACLSGRC